MKYILLIISLILFSTKNIFAESSVDWTKSADAIADIINNTGDKIGVAYAKQGTEGVLLRIQVSGLPAGIHGMHFHNIGNCSDHKHFQSAGGHIDTEKKPHGFLNPQGPHEGNLPNLIVDDSGKAHIELYSQLVSVNSGKMSLLDTDGSTLIIHANEDDHLSQPIGGAGERIACGVFKTIKD